MNMHVIKIHSDEPVYLNIGCADMATKLHAWLVWKGYAASMRLQPPVVMRSADAAERGKVLMERFVKESREDWMTDVINTGAKLERAIAFIDQCRANPREATEVGAFGDAREWLETAARAVVAAIKQGGAA